MTWVGQPVDEVVRDGFSEEVRGKLCGHRGPRLGEVLLPPPALSLLNHVPSDLRPFLGQAGGRPSCRCGPVVLPTTPPCRALVWPCPSSPM